MVHLHNRYPGAQPFSDTDFSRRTFFGRESASVALADQILANRLVVVYAKSGLGKSSLLKAGVAPRLRDAATVPLFVRLNDVTRDLLVSVVDGIKEETKRQCLEYLPGESGSLWSFFKSAEFWRGDLLLTPVLIVDQFEELFTLQPEAVRENFLADLGFLVRGVPPPSLLQDAGSSITTSAPPVHVVLSLREDFLGILEEGAEHIPQILDHRFRLTPLTCEAATQAITGPAAIDDSGLITKPFRLHDELVAVILNYLSKPSGLRGSDTRYVEPFHLQLICQRIERMVAVKQALSSKEVVLTFKDFGGHAALTQTLINFYGETIHSVPDKYLRPAVRRLCEEYLISPEGRRLSVEERELQRQLRLPHATLSLLVETRLLRTDRRSDSTYYELSHDALVGPVLGTRRTRALFTGWAALLAGSVISILTGAMVMLFIFVLFDTRAKDLSNAAVVAVIFFVPLSMLGWLGMTWTRSGLRTRARYRRHTPGELSEPLPTLLPLKHRLVGWTLAGSGALAIAWWGGIGLLLLIALLTRSISIVNAQSPTVIRMFWPYVPRRSFLELSWIIIELTGPILLSWIVCRAGLRILQPQHFRFQNKSPILGVDQQRPFALIVLRTVLGTCTLLLTVACSIGFLHCARRGIAPAWFPRHIQDLCHTVQQTSWKNIKPEGGLFFLAPLTISLVFLPAGIREWWNILRHRRLISSK